MEEHDEGVSEMLILRLMLMVMKTYAVENVPMRLLKDEVIVHQWMTKDDVEDLQNVMVKVVVENYHEIELMQDLFNT